MMIKAEVKVPKRHRGRRTSAVVIVGAILTVLSATTSSASPIDSFSSSSSSSSSSSPPIESIRPKRQLLFPGPVNFNTPPARPSRQNNQNFRRPPGQPNFNSNENFGFQNQNGNFNQQRPGGNFNQFQRPGNGNFNQFQRPGNGNFNQFQRPVNGNFNQFQRPQTGAGGFNQNQRPGGGFNQNQRPGGNTNQNIFNARPTQSSINARRTTRQTNFFDEDGGFVFGNSDEVRTSSTTPRNRPFMVLEGNSVNTVQNQFPFVAQSSVTDCQNNCHRTVTNEYNPVCGTDGATYTNPGKMRCAQTCGINVRESYKGACPGLQSSINRV